MPCLASWESKRNSCPVPPRSPTGTNFSLLRSASFIERPNWVRDRHAHCSPAHGCRRPIFYSNPARSGLQPAQPCPGRHRFVRVANGFPSNWSVEPPVVDHSDVEISASGKKVHDRGDGKRRRGRLPPSNSRTNFSFPWPPVSARQTHRMRSCRWKFPRNRCFGGRPRGTKAPCSPKHAYSVPPTPQGGLSGPRNSRAVQQRFVPASLSRDILFSPAFPGGNVRRRAQRGMTLRPATFHIGIGDSIQSSPGFIARSAKILAKMRGSILHSSMKWEF